MSKKSNKIKGGGLVYSTDPGTMEHLFKGINLGDGGSGSSEEAKQSSSFYDDIVRVWIDRKGRGGKEVTLIKGINKPDQFLKDLARNLKAQCGVGGSVKEGEIMIQGNHRDRIVDLLKEAGFENTKKAGG